MKNHLMSYVKFMHYKIIDNYRAILRQLWNCKYPAIDTDAPSESMHKIY